MSVVFPFFGYVRADEDWTRTATATATSAKDGYAATCLKTDDPTDNWWGNSGSETATLAWGSDVSVGVVAIIMPNVDHGRNVEIRFDGVLVETLQGARGKGGYPRNLAFFPDAPASVSEIAITVTGNTLDLSFGRIAVGPLRKFEGPASPGAQRTLKAGVSTDDYPEYNHSIDYAVSGQGWNFHASSMQFENGLQEMIDVWEASEYGVKRMLVVPSDSEQVRWVKCAPSVKYSTQIYRGVDLDFEEIGRGLLVA